MLITTDVLARGFDNREINVVVNLDIPKVHLKEDPDHETYLHRIGRCGRFGDQGIALNIVDDQADLTRLEKIKEIYSFEIQEIKE